MAQGAAFLTLLAAAVHNNAVWCDGVCRARGCETVHIDGLWVNRDPSPPYYPSAVTLEPEPIDVQFARVTAMLDWPLPRPWSVKDSFGRLDLAPLGFEVLFEAEWIGLSPAQLLPDAAAAADVTWSTIRHDPELAAWEQAWRGGSGATAVSDAARLFQPTLLGDPDVRFLAGSRDGRIVVVAVANRSDDGTGPVVGISNVILAGGDPEAHRPGAIAAVRRAFPGLAMVGYERGDDLIAMLALGCRSLGPLRVWVISA